MKDTPALRIMFGLAMMVIISPLMTYIFNGDSLLGGPIAAGVSFCGLALLIMGIVKAVKNRKARKPEPQ